MFKPVRIPGAFWLCSLGVVALLVVPHLGGNDTMWINGLYDALCVIVFFPLLIWLGAFGKDYRQEIYGYLQILRRYLLSGLRGALPLNVSILCLGVGQRSYVRADLVRWFGTHYRVIFF